MKARFSASGGSEPPTRAVRHRQGSGRSWTVREPRSVYSTTLTLAAGDRVDFVVGFGSNGNYFFDSTALHELLRSLKHGGFVEVSAVNAGADFEPLPEPDRPKGADCSDFAGVDAIRLQPLRGVYSDACRRRPPGTRLSRHNAADAK
jgi:hypothetical protein